MKITQQFHVGREMAAVWNAFQDIPSVAQCLPGASLTGQDGPDTYTGVVSVKLGPMTPTFEGRATVSADAASHTGTIKGVGSDRRGGSRGEVAVVYRLSEDDQEGGTTVAIEADVTLSGAAAQFGRTSVLNDISARLIREFARCLEAKLSAGTAEARAAVGAPEVNGLSLALSSAGAQLRRAAERVPAPAVAAVVVGLALAVLAALRRRRR